MLVGQLPELFLGDCLGVRVCGEYWCILDVNLVECYIGPIYIDQEMVTMRKGKLGRAELSVPLLVMRSSDIARLRSAANTHH